MSWLVDVGSMPDIVCRRNNGSICVICIDNNAFQAFIMF